MNGYWLRITGMSLLALGACATSKFSEDFSSEIQRDCLETVACNLTASFESCVNNTGSSLDNASVSKQQFFVDAVYRCQGAARCDYVTCTQSTANTGWAATHLTEVSHDCRERLACKIAGGSMPSAGAVESCIQETSNRLNANPPDQPAFEARYARCGTLMGCSYGACQ
jgi:hypothetical protein